MSYSESISLNLTLAFHTVSNGLYSWKFQGKELLTDLINCLTEYRILLSPKLLNSENHSEVKIYSIAKENCLKEAFRKLSLFENHLEKYSEGMKNLEKLSNQSRLQKELLCKKLENFKGTENQKGKNQLKKEYDFMIMELLELTFELSNQYTSQNELLKISKNDIIGGMLNNNNASFLDSYPSDGFFYLSIENLNRIINDLEILLMNVQYETQINNENRDKFVDTLSKMSNKRGQMNK